MLAKSSKYNAGQLSSCARFYFSPELILFGFVNEIKNDKPLNFITLFAEFYINKCNMNELYRDISSFLRQLKKRLMVEGKVIEINSKNTRFEREWTMYKRMFNFIET